MPFCPLSTLSSVSLYPPNLSHNVSILDSPVSILPFRLTLITAHMQRVFAKVPKGEYEQNLARQVATINSNLADSQQLKRRREEEQQEELQARKRRNQQDHRERIKQIEVQLGAQTPEG